MTRVHSLQHVQRFLATHLTHDDAIGAHTEGVDHQLTLLHRAFSLNVGGPRFQAYDVVLVQLQLRGVFNRDDAFAIGNVGGQHVEERGLAGAGAARNQNVEARFHATTQKFQHSCGERVVLEQIVSGERITAETPDREAGAVDRQRGNDGVHA